MYHLYHTSAFVLANSPRGEGNKVFTLFTRELGLILATATSVREERSKLRYGLQDFSLSQVTLVRGKESWRLTNAVLEENLWSAFREAPEAIAFFARVSGLLRRLLTGEEKNERLFDAVREAVTFLKESYSPFVKESTPIPIGGRDLNPPSPTFQKKWGTPPFTKEELKIAEVEIILVLRILYLLGYLAPRGEFETVLSDISLWNDKLLSEAKVFRPLALADINHSLKQSQL